MGQDFHWNFLVKVTRIFVSFSELVHKAVDFSASDKAVNLPKQFLLLFITTRNS